MPNTYARKAKKVKLKMLLFFLFIAFFIWFLTKFSKEFTATVNASIQYNNLPNKTVVRNTIYDEISFELTTNGFDFIIYKIKKPTIEIAIDNYYSNGDLTIRIENKELNKIISSQLINSKIIKNISIDDMIIVLDTIESKKIPVLLLTDISFQNGYKSVDSLLIKPDSIMVSGPSLTLDSIQLIKTKRIKLRDVKTNISEEIEIDTSNESNLSYSHGTVKLTSTVEEFTQKKIVLPIEIINLPPGTSIKLIPEVITITLDVSLNNFNSIKEQDFKIICDYNKRNNEENFMVPELISKPEKTVNIEFQEKKIDYLIFK